MPEIPFLDPLEDFLVSFLGNQIYLAPILLLIIEEGGLPIPIPGDIIIAYVGYEVSRGVINYYVAFGLILLSVLTGASILYFLSVHFGQRLITKFGSTIHLDEKRLVTVEKYFNKFGPWAIIFGRHIPGFRAAITVFSGMSKITYKTFILSTFVSVIFWIAFYLELGRRLGPKTIQLLKAHHLYYLFGIVLVVALLLFFVVQRWKKGKGKHV